MGSALSNMFPPKASFTEANLPDQSDKVFIVTGSSGGLGKELTKILYQKNAKIYMACRSEAKTAAVIKELKELYPNSHGHAEYLHLDLNDLTTIKQSAQEFLSKETRLDVLWNNAGVMTPPPGSKTAQGYELQLGTNNLAPFLFTHFLRPVLSGTAKVAPRDSVRVVWVSSSTAAMAPKPPIDFSNMDYAKDEGQVQKYARSKAGNVLHGTEFARRVSGEGIISVSLDPGIFMTDLQRTMPLWQRIIVKFLAHKPINGAYTELFAGLSPTITEKNNGGWVVPFGQLAVGRQDLRDKELGKKYWEWTEKQLKPYTTS
ncbi:short-chain dehydrogenase [Colletotrichum filicis]|nr:short-chain dehydrogenase [Colletotrichum filicis]KAK1703044.1 short-chain dehydrogenase [Colletotrichum lupini]